MLSETQPVPTNDSIRFGLPSETGGLIDPYQTKKGLEGLSKEDLDKAVANWTSYFDNLKRLVEREDLRLPEDGEKPAIARVVVQQRLCALIEGETYAGELRSGGGYIDRSNFGVLEIHVDPLDGLTDNGQWLPLFGTLDPERILYLFKIQVLERYQKERRVLSLVPDEIREGLAKGSEVFKRAVVRQNYLDELLITCREYISQHISQEEDLVVVKEDHQLSGIEVGYMIESDPGYGRLMPIEDTINSSQVKDRTTVRRVVRRSDLPIGFDQGLIEKSVASANVIRGVEMISGNDWVIPPDASYDPRLNITIDKCRKVLDGEFSQAEKDAAIVKLLGTKSTVGVYEVVKRKIKPSEAIAALVRMELDDRVWHRQIPRRMQAYMLMIKQLENETFRANLLKQSATFQGRYWNVLRDALVEGDFDLNPNIVDRSRERVIADAWYRSASVSEHTLVESVGVVDSTTARVKRADLTPLKPLDVSGLLPKPKKKHFHE